MEILLFTSFLIIFNIVISKYIDNKDRKKLIYLGALIICIIAPLLSVITGISLGIISGDGIGGFAAGFLLGLLILLNGLFYLLKGILSKK